jgi:hypothetical protein
VALKGKVTKDSIEDLIKANKLPPTIAFNDANSQKIFSSGIERQVRGGGGPPSQYWMLRNQQKQQQWWQLYWGEHGRVRCTALSCSTPRGACSSTHLCGQCTARRASCSGWREGLGERPHASSPLGQHHRWLVHMLMTHPPC